VTPQSLNISLLQVATHWHDPQANREMFGRLLATLPEDTHLVLLPEMFSTGFTMASAEVAETMSGATVQWLMDQAARHSKVLCGSLVVEDQGQYFNRFLCAYPDGELAVYDKRHLFRMAGEHKYYTAGDTKLVVTINGWRVCPLVCYDLRFPVWFRNRGDYDLLLCVANWPGARREAWTTLLRARAIENQVYVAAVNIVGTDGNSVDYTGGSAVYTPEGSVMLEAFDTPTTLSTSLDYAKLETLRAQFPVWQDADDFELNV
jgi:omega-amidase